MTEDSLNFSSTQPKVSVIMNCFNSSKYLREAIDSVYAQTYKDWEIIFWDNASTDNSAEIAKSCGEKVRYFRSDKTYPLGEARNLAIEKVEGRYIAFLDCDDIWLPEKLEKQVQIFDSSLDIGLVYSDCYEFIDNGTNREMIFCKVSDRVKFFRGKILEYLWLENFIPILTVIVRREILEKAGPFSTDLDIVEDWDILLRIAEFADVDFIDIPLAKYRIHQGNISKNRELRIRESIIVLERCLERYPNLKDTLGSKVSKRFIKFHCNLGLTYILKKGLGKALKEFVHSLKISPYYTISYLFFLLPLLGNTLLGKLMGNKKKS